MAYYPYSYTGTPNYFNTYNPYAYPNIYPNYYGTGTSTPSSVQPSQTSYPNVSVIWISDEKEVSTYPVAPNSAVALWDYIGKKIHMKQADATGKPTVKTYSLIEESQEENKEEVVPVVDFSAIDELKASLSDLRKDISGFADLQKDVESMKKEMYGLAGKKKNHKSEDD